MNCEKCAHWTVRRATAYGDGIIIENWKAEPGKGQCDSLGIETSHDFGCNRFMEGDAHDALARKDGAPWQHFIMIKCPSCSGAAGCHGRCQCAGTGLVRLYDDGYVGDEQTRMHPNEKPLPTKCPSCEAPVEPGWAHCPSCGAKLWKVAETEIIDDGVAGLPPPETMQE